MRLQAYSKLLGDFSCSNNPSGPLRRSIRDPEPEPEVVEHRIATDLHHRKLQRGPTRADRTLCHDTNPRIHKLKPQEG